ncbi:MAG: HD domain-containing protein [Verrucomicrobiota bacterium]
MDPADLSKRLEFLRQSERLKDTIRSAHTTQGRTESVAEHTWRFTLTILTFSDLLPEIDLLKLLKICIIHDLGEGISGDIPAPEQSDSAPKSEQERDDFIKITKDLPESLQIEFLELWDDYEYVRSDEAKIAKAFDKLETLLQHTQGKNPENFDYVFNLGYGRLHTDAFPLSKALRNIIDTDTKALANNAD